jgi:putative FmdB family regulatory protein
VRWTGPWLVVAQARDRGRYLCDRGGIVLRMPMYEYRCRACGHTFDKLRAVAQADDPADCTCGSADTARLPSMIARVGSSLPMAGGSSAPAPSAGGGGGSCCGGGCCG